MADTEIGELFSVRLRAGVGIVVGATAALLLALYVFIPTRRAEFTYTASVLAGAGTMYAAFYAAASLHAAARRDRQTRAFALLAALSQHEATKVQALCDRVIGTDAISSKDLADKVAQDAELQHAVTYILGHFEDISIAIQEDHADERILFRSLQRIVPLYWTKLGSYIKQQRQTTGSDVLYCEFEGLAKAWGAGHSLRSGESFPRSVRDSRVGGPP